MGVKKLSIGDFRNRVRFKQNTPTPDGAGGYTDVYAGHDLEIGVFEVWANVTLKTPSRAVEMAQTRQVRTYTIITRATFGYTMDLVPKKNMLVEIVGFTTNDAVVHGVVWDDWNNYWVINAEEQL